MREPGRIDRNILFVMLKGIYAKDEIKKELYYIYTELCLSELHEKKKLFISRDGMRNVLELTTEEDKILIEYVCCYLWL